MSFKMCKLRTILNGANALLKYKSMCTRKAKLVNMSDSLIWTLNIVFILYLWSKKPYKNLF